MISRNEPATSAQPHHVLVLGGGICGLGAADEAVRLGHTVTVVEQATEIGGLLTTDRRDGFSFDRGGHRFITAIPWVLQRVQELLGDRLLVRERKMNLKYSAFDTCSLLEYHVQKSHDECGSSTNWPMTISMPFPCSFSGESF